MKIAAGFKKFTGEHCATSAIRQVFSCQGIKLSEEMLLGLGEGIGFEYRIDKKTGLPLLSMRGAGLFELESNICKRLGIEVKAVKSKNKKTAEKELFKMLEKDQSAVVYVEIGALPYVGKGSVCHMGVHAVAVAGFDPDEGNVLVADSDEPFHRVEFKALAVARDAAWCPSLHDNTMLKLTYPKTLAPIAAAIEAAAASAATKMMNPKAKTSGVQGIRFFAEDIVSWPDRLDPKSLGEALKRIPVLIDDSDCGGGGFRKMYGRFLGEASRMLKDPEVSSLANNVTGLARKWSTLASKVRSIQPGRMFGEAVSASKKIEEIADSEEDVWVKQMAIFR
jgi:hypothetical protein